MSSESSVSRQFHCCTPPLSSNKTTLAVAFRLRSIFIVALGLFLPLSVNPWLETAASQQPQADPSLSEGFSGEVERLDLEIDSQPANEGSIDQWIQYLSADNYLRRERASRRLIKAGPEAVDALATAVQTGDLEVVERAAAAMMEIAISVPPRDDGGAYERLKRLSTQTVGRPASIAKGALVEIQEFRSQQARKFLARAGVFVGLAEFSIGAMSRQRMLVEINENWNGDVETLQWLTWLSGYDNVRLEKGSATVDVIREVTKMPDLRSLILADAEVSTESLEVLATIPRLDTLEFQYSKLAESHGDLIAKLPLRTSLILMGTGLSQKRADQLIEELPGLQIQYRRGGFLGVMCIDNFDVCEVTGIQEGSAAEAAGLMRGDVITMVNETEIKHFRDLQKAINQHVPGDEVEVKYQRAGQEKALKLELRRYQES